MFTIQPVLTEEALGTAGWRVLHEDARRLGRRPTKQALALIRYALKQRLDGRNVELNAHQLDRLFNHLGMVLQPEPEAEQVA